MTTETTDPALELAAMARWLLQVPGAASPAAQYLAIQLKLDWGSADYLSLLSEVRRRLDRLAEFAKRIDDKDFDDHQKKEVQHAVTNLAAFFHPQHLMGSFAQNRNDFVKDHDATALKWFSHIAQRHRPLRRITDEMRKEALAAIDEALDKVKQDTELPLWAVPILLEGLERVKLTITHFTFFGHDATIESLLVLDRQTKAMMEFLKAKGKDVCQGVWAAAKAATVCVSLFNAPSTTHHAFVEYRDLVQKLLSKPPDPLALPKPTDPHSNTDQSKRTGASESSIDV